MAYKWGAHPNPWRPSWDPILQVTTIQLQFLVPDLNYPYQGLLGQWLNFKLFGITYLVLKISRSNFFFQGPLAEWEGVKQFRGMII